MFQLRDQNLRCLPVAALGLRQHLEEVIWGHDLVFIAHLSEDRLHLLRGQAMGRTDVLKDPLDGLLDDQVGVLRCCGLHNIFLESRW